MKKGRGHSSFRQKGDFFYMPNRSFNTNLAIKNMNKNPQNNSYTNDSTQFKVVIVLIYFSALFLLTYFTLDLYDFNSDLFRPYVFIKTKLIISSNFKTTVLIINVKKKKAIIFFFKKLYRQFIKFMKIWPLGQWISSLITLVILYLGAGSYYNKKLRQSGGWLTMYQRIYIILIDLLVNLSIGMYYMNYRDTLLGSFMLECPIAISPFIFLIELAIVHWYYKKYTLPKIKEDLKKMENLKKSSKEVKIMTNLNSGTESQETLKLEQTWKEIHDDEERGHKMFGTENEVDAKSGYRPRPRMETRFSIALQKTLFKKIRAAVWQFFRFGHLLDEPQDKQQREELKKEIEYRYKKDQLKKLTR
jgi:hypothetical protein